jgi:SAM-dependent methyltransferase
MGTKCRACGESNLVPIIDLGAQPASNAFKKTSDQPEVLYPLRAVYCSYCFLMQLSYDAAPTELFGKEYAYFSQNSQDWLDHTQRYCAMAVKRFGLRKDDSIVLEIGGNDGHLLANLKDHVLRAINIEPSASVAAVSTGRGVETWVEYFKPQQIQADLIIANNVMAHVPYLDGFVMALSRSLKPTGRITIEFPHALTLLVGTQFDTIYHEHYSYLSLTALNPLFKKYGLYVYDVEKLSTHGGSLRLYVGKVQKVQASIEALWYEEEPLRRPEIYQAFANAAQHCRDGFQQWLSTEPQVLAYGAAAKGNTFLNYCGVTAKDIPQIADTTPAKQGLYLPGSCIPVVLESIVLAQKPKHLLVLPWNWQEEIVRRVRRVNPNQRFATAIPTLNFC